MFHMSRCGSTLTANLLGASPDNLVYSESKPPPQLIGMCETNHCTEEQRVSAMRLVDGLILMLIVAHEVISERNPPVVREEDVPQALNKTETLHGVESRNPGIGREMNLTL